MTTGEKIAKLRRQAGLSQEAFSEKLGISRQAVSKWENGTAQPANENLAQIARLFDVTISYLLDDEDMAGVPVSTQEEQNVENPPENPKITAERKGLKVNALFNSLSIIILGITTIAQSYTMAGLKNDIAYLKNRLSSYSTLQAQVAALENNLYNSGKSHTASEDFTDYHYTVTEYNRETNMATLHFSVVPKDYSRDTVAEIVIKCRGNSYSALATRENNIFVADVEVCCEDSMDVYLYLTENGKTRSFILDWLANPAFDYILSVNTGVYDGEITVKDGTARINGNLRCTIGYVINEDIVQSVYPVKATIEFYNNGQLLKTIPFDTVMRNDFIATGKHEIDITGQAQYSEEVTFSEYFDFTVESNSIKAKDHNIGIRVVVADNNGNEYISDADNYRTGPLPAES